MKYRDDWEQWAEQHTERPEDSLSFASPELIRNVGNAQEALLSEGIDNLVKAVIYSAYDSKLKLPTSIRRLITELVDEYNTIYKGTEDV